MPIKVMKENRLEDTMGIFDKLKNTAQQAVVSAVQSAGNKRETFTFSALPESLAEMQALPEASLDTPFKPPLSPCWHCVHTLPTKTSEQKCLIGSEVRVR